MDTIERSGAVLVAALLIFAAIAPAGAAALRTAPSSPGETPAVTGLANNTTDMEPADEVYLRENGDAVLVYEEDTEADNDLDTARLGANLSEGLFHFLATNTSDEISENITADTSLTLSQNGFVGTAGFTAPQPEEVESLELSIDGERTEKTSKADASFEALITPENQAVQTINSVTGSGTVQVGAESLHMSGDIDVESILATETTEQVFDITESGNGYRIDASQEYTVSRLAESRWSSRERAQRTLESQFGSVARQLGGQSEISLDSYDFDSDTRTLDIEYTVRYTGIDEGLSQRLAASLAAAEDFDLSSEEASEIADRIQELQINRVQVEYRQGAGSVDANWKIDIDNYDQLAIAMLDIAESAEGEQGLDQAQIDRIRDRIEARKAADLQRTTTWSLQIERSDGIQATGEFHTESENWQAYVSELQDRGIEVGTNRYNATITSNDDEITMDANLQVSREALLDRALDSIIQSAENDPDTDEDVVEFFEAFKDSEFEKARFDLSIEDSTITMEGGAKFENLSAFDRLSESSYRDLSIEEIAVRKEGDTTRTYVYVTDLADGDVTPDDVEQASQAIDSDTRIYMPGDYDEEFPRMNVQEVEDYVGVEEESEGGDGSDGDEGIAGGLPGFGVGAALLALLGAALLARRRVD